ncbi:phage tail protein [Alcaligenes sp. DN25]|uniref:phage tail protein n=1 Tax=Alcaligenes TaxID=507 RepID=UPI00202F7B83|nr:MULTISPECIES: Ig-like domain-containing protein [Alcaligenes]URW84492.1 phage tail protein [Alcaligenes sp. DN25]WEA69333.1 Ig-like domain-containing protein [Alcaligenes faecalis]
MATCKNQKFVGRTAILEYAIGCGDQMPAAADWKRLGAMRAKELTIEWETTDATADDSIGALRENLAAFQTLSVSGDGVLKVAGTGAAALIALTKHVIKPEATGGEPVAWIRLTFPDLTFTFFSIVTNMSRSAPYDDVATYSFEASATASDFGLMVEDTPDPDAPAVDTVVVTPATASIVEGATRQLTAAITPTGAAQGVIWSSSDTDTATVSQTGLVTAVVAGTATITATSTADSAKKGECAVTVTA